jgi:uncharacterized coiled-coil protein SlyX
MEETTMTTERWNDEMLDRFASTVTTAIQANNDAIAAGNARMDRLEQVVTELTQVVGSNNRYMEAFSQDLRRYTENLDNISQQLAASTARANDERYETSTRLSSMSRKLTGVDIKIDRLLGQREISGDVTEDLRNLEAAARELLDKLNNRDNPES